MKRKKKLQRQHADEAEEHNILERQDNDISVLAEKQSKEYEEMLAKLQGEEMLEQQRVQQEDLRAMALSKALTILKLSIR